MPKTYYARSAAPTGYFPFGESNQSHGPLVSAPTPKAWVPCALRRREGFCLMTSCHGQNARPSMAVPRLHRGLLLPAPPVLGADEGDDSPTAVLKPLWRRDEIVTPLRGPAMNPYSNGSFTRGFFAAP